MDLEALLGPRSEDAPSGEDPSYGPDFMMLELAAQPGEERQVGDVIVAAEDPDFKAVMEAADPVLTAAHDLRTGVIVAWAQLRMAGLPGFAQATSYLRGCLEQHWDTCHPQLDADDNNDPTERVNSILSLAAEDTILKGLKITPLTDSRTFGRLSIRDMWVADGEITASEDMENIPDAAAVAAAFQESSQDYLNDVRNGAQTSLENIEAIGEKFDAETPGQGPALDPLVKLLKQIIKRLDAALGTTGAEDVSEDAAGETAGDDGGPRAGGAVGGISSPNDVQNALDRIIAYYARYEPSSPVPMLLMRAKRLVNADFLTIVKDMAPNGVDNVNLIGGIQEDSSWE